MKMVSCFGERSRPIIAIVSIFGLGMLYSCYFFNYSPIVFIIVYSSGLGILRAGYSAGLLKSIWSLIPEEKRGTGTGIIATGYGLGSFLFSILVEQLTNP
jgi:MFS family permease